MPVPCPQSNTLETRWIRVPRRSARRVAGHALDVNTSVNAFPSLEFSRRPRYPDSASRHVRHSATIGEHPVDLSMIYVTTSWRLANARQLARALVGTCLRRISMRLLTETHDRSLRQMTTT